MSGLSQRVEFTFGIRLSSWSQQGTTSLLPTSRRKVMGRRLDIGIAAYGKGDALANVIDSINKLSVTDWSLRIIVNPHLDPGKQAAVDKVVDGIEGGNISIH